MAKVINDKSGSQVESIQEYEIATGTVITEGEFVKLSSGKVIPVVAGETAAILGVAKEAHSGSADALNARSNGLKVLVSDSTTAVYSVPVPTATATSGTTTTFVVSGLGSVFSDDDFNGGKLKIKSKATASTNTDVVGTVYDITDFTGSSATFTFATAGGAITAGDIMEIYPPIGFQKGNFDAAFQKIVLTASATMPVRSIGYNTDMGVVRLEAALHELGNKKA